MELPAQPPDQAGKMRLSITIDADIFYFIKTTAEEDRRTISGQINYIIGQVMEAAEQAEEEERG